MLKKNIQFCFFFLCSIIIHGQSSPDFNILADKAFQKLYQNPDDCINYSLSILISDQNIEHRIVLRNIISQAYAMNGDYVKSVNISSQKDEAGEKEKLSYFMQVFANYNLADQYQNLDLYNQSQRIISNLLTDKNLLKSDNIKIKTTVAKLYQLQALNFGIKRNYNAALENLKKSNNYLGFDNEENLILGVENKVILSSYLMRQNRLEDAKHILENTLIFVESRTNYNFLQALIYENLARYYFLKGNYKTSIENLEKGLSKIENNQFYSLRVKFYESLAKNYFALHNDEKYQYNNKLYIEIRTKIDTSAKEGIRYIVRLVENNQNENLEFQQQNESKQFWIITLIFSSIIIILIIYLFTAKSTNNDLKKQSEFFEKQKKWQETHRANLPKEVIPEKTIEKDSNKISKEKENEILQKLNEWEQFDFYLNKNMSLSTLSAQMGVNTKYLSEVINTNKGKNFNGYINELRINHIAHLLKTNPAFLNYKVSYLAEFSGFSSHSAFTTVFKSITGMSPNAYIQEISKNRTS
ncbi:helix-turn-helix domain-containing protein [Chryseobacterium sp. FH2]|uniref:helix-turn-helix domain-containing protein n=1 Tax=Chryseobacterium sp. FH2 TaxID=1674291 RepID=UPI000A9D2DE4|nr:helix-turn-helix domain-containing protein [Chryseobacterium sp. FH2]